ncbi:MAG TPA: hypothetical protein VD973_00050 [Symbiobacteriaceae bacterium]|nr:hypothetical protein [Symbiobacteriaceae bacterium]
MSESKRSVLVDIIRKAVGLPTGAESCCTSGVAEKPAASCCGGGTAQAKQSSAGCCDAGARAEQSGSACCGK